MPGNSNTQEDWRVVAFLGIRTRLRLGIAVCATHCQPYCATGATYASCRKAIRARGINLFQLLDALCGQPEIKGW